MCVYESDYVVCICVYVCHVYSLCVYIYLCVMCVTLISSHSSILFNFLEVKDRLLYSGQEIIL